MKGLPHHDPSFLLFFLSLFVVGGTKPSTQQILGQYSPTEVKLYASHPVMARRRVTT